VSGERVHLLLDEFAAAHARGEHPDVKAYLERAGAQYEELAELLDRYLIAVPAQPPDPETAALLDARLAREPGESLLQAYRVKLRLKRGEVVDAVVAALGLPPDRSAKVGRYYHELESGLLEPDRVNVRVWEALAGAFGAPVRRLAEWSPPPAEPAMLAMYRSANMDVAVSTRRPADVTEAEWDEVDELFLGPKGLSNDD
jgi:hypothetical protein